MKFKYPVSFIGPHNLTGKASLEDNLETEDLWTVKIYILEGHLASSRFNFFGELLLQYSKLNYYNYIPEISGILWFWSGRRRTPRLVFHVTVTPRRVSNSYLTQPLMTYSGRTLSILEQIGKTKMAAGGHFVKN